MSITVEPNSPTPMYQQIVDQVEAKILKGDWMAGDALPSVRALSRELKINGLTIQKAFKKLEESQMISIKKGIGAFVSENVKPMGTKKIKTVAKKRITEAIDEVMDLGLKVNDVKEIVEDILEKKND